MKKKTRSTELVSFDRFIEDMAEVLEIPRKKLDKMVFQYEGTTAKAHVRRPVMKRKRALATTATK